MVPSETKILAISPTHSLQKECSQPPRCVNCEPGLSEKQMPQQCTSCLQISNSSFRSYSSTSMRADRKSVHSATARSSATGSDITKCTRRLSPKISAASLRSMSAQANTTGMPGEARSSISAQRRASCSAVSQRHAKWNTGLSSEGYFAGKLTWSVRGGRRFTDTSKRGRPLLVLAHAGAGAAAPLLDELYIFSRARSRTDTGGLRPTCWS
mmetsp:Transcript_44043/g.121898  ORF Transcript_44043/g.121898 Transcript_44043/m.121898 type:complete len:211 (-) Transcript_44043:226-858(-)